MRIKEADSDSIKLIQGDCLELLPTIPDGSIDMVLTSPPYNMNLRIRDGKYCSRQIVKELSTKYTNFSDNLSMEEYFIFNKTVLNNLLRVSDLVFYNVQFLTGNKPALFKLIGHFNEKIKEFIIWDKCNAEPAIGRGVMNSQFEVLLVLQNSYPQSRSFSTAQFDRGTLANLWRIKRGKKITSCHRATFPVELATTVISNFSHEGAKILDPFMGIGTTGVACVNTNRSFIGIELDSDYIAIARERVEAVTQTKPRRLANPT